MKALTRLCMLTLLGLNISCLAQNTIRAPHDYAKSQDLIDKYSVRAAIGAGADERSLVTIYMHDLAPTPGNVETVQHLLAIKRPHGDRVILVRILARLYTRDNQSGKNEQILRSLKSIIYGGDREMASSALLSYARLPYQMDVLELLSFGYENKLLQKDEYCRELAISLLPDAPPASQVAAARTLQQLDSERGAEVLATVLNSRESVERLAVQARPIVLAALRRREPVMPMALGQFGFFSGTRYASWLHTVALLTASVGGESYNATALRYLSDENIDPRKILGYLSSNFGIQLMRNVGHRQPFDLVASRGFSFAEQFPGHSGMSPMVGEIKNALATLPE